jgi:prepilin-type N-terminal cleavage/methylation domain-containing protein
MKRSGDHLTRQQGDPAPARAAAAAASSCHPVSSSPRRPRRRAFTLPEVLATLVLVGLVLPAVMKGISLALAASDDARRRVEAVGLAENKLAELAADATVNQSSSGGGSGEFGDEAPGYRWESSTASVETDLLELNVRVAWTARGRERHVDLSTYAYVSGAAGGTGTSTAGGSGGGTP